MISNTLKFCIYLIVLIPSLICLLFILYHLLSNRNLRSALNNHGMIILLLTCLVMEVATYPWTLYFNLYEGTWDRSLIFCEIWGFIDWGFYITQNILFAWITIERHILIFHERWIATRKKRFFVHYFPIVFLLAYCFIFYMILFFFPPCENHVLNFLPFCINACLLSNYVYGMCELIVNQVLPSIIILIFAIALFVRVLWQKYRIHQPVQWRKHRKMAMQVLYISLLYPIFFFPLVVANFMVTYGLSREWLGSFYEYASFLSYFMTPLLVFVSAFSLPELRKTFLPILYLIRKPIRIQPDPLNITTARQN